MNVFFTNECPITAANEHCKKHRNKMIVEYAQLLSTAHHEFGSAFDGIYKRTHVNHPSAVWVRQSKTNYTWVWLCAMELCEMYRLDTGKNHKTESVLELLIDAPVSMSDIGLTTPSVAAPDEFKALAVFNGVCVAYQKYLVAKFAEWQQRDKPITVEFDSTPAWYVL